MSTKITKNTTLEKILNQPGAQEILAKYHVPCIACPMAAYEIGSLKLDDVAKMYGIDLSAMLKELNTLDTNAQSIKKKSVKKK